VEQATTDADRAVALQSWFRSGAFVYDVTASPARSSDKVWDFLESRHGYCVHFATAMAVMARQIGIPSRVAVGFLPGTEHDGWYEVTGGQAHAWPELWFDSVGWVRFEPTPGSQSGAAPSWTTDRTVATPSPSQATPTSRPTGASPTPVTSSPAASTSGASTSATAPPTGSAAPGRGSDGQPLWPWLVGAAALLVAGGAAALVARRRVSSPSDIEAAWSEARSRCARRGAGWPASTPPNQVPAAVAVLLRDRADHRVVAALTALASELNATRYSPHGGGASSDQIRAWLADLDAGLAARRPGENKGL
jgi:hypothetical protein